MGYCQAVSRVFWQLRESTGYLAGKSRAAEPTYFSGDTDCFTSCGGGGPAFSGVVRDWVSPAMVFVSFFFGWEFGWEKATLLPRRSCLCMVAFIGSLPQLLIVIALVYLGVPALLRFVPQDSKPVMFSSFLLFRKMMQSQGFQVRAFLGKLVAAMLGLSWFPALALVSDKVWKTVSH